MIEQKKEKIPKSKIDLRKLMEKLGMGTNAFAEACGVSTQSMAQYLRVESITTKTIYKIATALDIDPRDMFFPTEEPQPPIQSEIVADKENVKEHTSKKENDLPQMQTTTFCPHCGGTVHVGVMLIPAIRK